MDRSYHESDLAFQEPAHRGLLNGDGKRLHASGDWRVLLPTQKKIAIVGTAPDSCKLAPYDDPSWQIWITNDFALSGVPRWDACFEPHLHDFPGKIPTEHAWLCREHGPRPVFMARPRPEYPNSVPYPLQEMTDKFGRYFKSTVSYALAMAIEFGAEQIGLWGVNMAHSTEYADQRASCEYFLGIAKGRGIAHYLPPQSDLLKAAYLYGMEEPFVDAKWRARFAEQTEIYKQLEAQRDQMEINMAFRKGVLDDLHYWAGYFVTQRDAKAEATP